MNFFNYNHLSKLPIKVINNIENMVDMFKMNKIKFRVTKVPKVLRVNKDTVTLSTPNYSSLQTFYFISLAS
jgi:hypothetical protein